MSDILPFICGLAIGLSCWANERGLARSYKSAYEQIRDMHRELANEIRRFRRELEDKSHE
jgi:hypothetical protein